MTTQHAQTATPHSNADRGGPCANCGAPLSNKYCSSCGQPAHFHRSLGHMLEEMLHGVLHFDTRAWRTLPMLVRNPGKLTRDYVFGRRARYISPLALFLCLVFTMYIVFTAMGGSSIGVGTPGENAEIAEQGPTQTQESSVGPAPEEPAPVSQSEVLAMISEAAVSGELAVNTGNPWLNKKINDKLKNPAFAIYKIQNAAYKFSFLLLPISLPFLWLLFFWKKGVTLFDHSAFILYSLSFVSLLMLVTAVVSRLVPPLADLAGLIFPLAPPIHMYFHLKGAYALGWLSAPLARRISGPFLPRLLQHLSHRDDGAWNSHLNHPAHHALVCRNRCTNQRRC